MAFSLADHLLNTQQAALATLVPALDKTSQKPTVLTVLAQFIALDQADATASYKAIKFNDIGFFSDGINNLPQSHAMQISGLLIDQINQLDDAASFGQEGVSELIQSQHEFLDAPSAAAKTQEATDVDSNIASLNKIMFSASQTNHDPEEQPFFSFFRIFKLSILIFIIAIIAFWFFR